MYMTSFAISTNILPIVAPQLIFVRSMQKSLCTQLKKQETASFMNWPSPSLCSPPPSILPLHPTANHLHTLAIHLPSTPHSPFFLIKDWVSEHVRGWYWMWRERRPLFRSTRAIFLRQLQQRRLLRWLRLLQHFRQLQLL